MTPSTTFAIVGALALGGASSSSRASTASPVLLIDSQSEWRDARAELVALRRQVPTTPRVELVRISVRGQGGVRFDGRGAVAIKPHHALRMVLLGPAGRTALDVWATPERYRLAVPDLDIVEQGGTSAPTHLPIELFREWFMTPLGGRLLAAGTTRSGDRIFILKANARSLELRIGAVDVAGRRRYSIRKHDATGGESAEWEARTLWPGVGDVVRFRRPSMGLELAVEIEGLSSDPPEDAAFDPPTASIEGAP